MQIKSIESFVLSDKLKESFYFSQWEYSERKICIVKITTTSGHVGWGEGYGPAAVIKAGVEHLAQFIIGMYPLESETIWSVMYRRTLDYARRGVLVSAISAIDVALWDLKGKILNQPVYMLLGGKMRDKIIPYATGLYFTKCNNLADKLCDEAKLYVDMGFKAIKMKVGLGINQDIAIVERVRNTIGDNIELMVDSNHAYNLREAVQLANAIEKYNIGWFEEPISPEFYEQYSELRSKTNIPIAGGECEYLKYGFKTLLESKSVDIIQPDICGTGGLSEAKKIATLASVFGVEVVPHSWGTGIALSAAAHFITNLDHVPGRLNSKTCMMEYDRSENGLREELTVNSIKFEDGIITLGDKPGLGFEVNEEALHKYMLK
mgnify:CR=1 FL=1